MNVLFILNGKPYISDLTLHLARSFRKHGVRSHTYVTNWYARLKFGEQFAAVSKMVNKGEAPSGPPCPAPRDWLVFFESWDRKVNSGFVRLRPLEARREIDKLYRDLDWLIVSRRIDLVIDEVPSNLAGRVAFQLARHRGIRFIGLAQSRIPNRIEVYENGYYFGEPFSAAPDPRTFSEMELCRALHKNFVHKKALPSYMYDRFALEPSLNLAYLLLKRVKDVAFVLRLLAAFLFRGGRRDYETTELVKHGLLEPAKIILRKLRKPALVRYLSPRGFLRGRSYYLFPLHVEPESSVSGQARAYFDTVTAITNIAFSLPLDSFLAVKEHPAFHGKRAPAYYRQLKKIPNVIILSHRADTRRLLANAGGCITLTGTLGLESVFLRKPTFVLGDTFYDGLPGLHKITGFEDLYRKLREPPPAPITDEEALRFWHWYYRHTVPGNLITLDFSQTAEALAALLGLPNGTEIHAR